jgi:hypothetical protein
MATNSSFDAIMDAINEYKDLAIECVLATDEVVVQKKSEEKSAKLDQIMTLIKSFKVGDENEFNPEFLANKFLGMNSFKQANFFNAMALQVRNSWGLSYAFHWESMKEHLIVEGKGLLDLMKLSTDKEQVNGNNNAR